jgi:hypothetical protein
MKELSRFETSAKYVVPAIVFVIVTLCVLAVWNTSAFDLWWIFGTFAVASFITFIIIAPQLLPIGNSAEELRRARRIFFLHLSGKSVPITLVRDGKIIYTAPLPPQTSSREEDEEITLGVVISDSTSVVVLRTETGISRLVGPNIEYEQLSSGAMFLYPEEIVDSIVDLRPQVRRRKVRARTSDGINIDLRVRAQFALRHTRGLQMRELAELKYQAGSEVHSPSPLTWQYRSIFAAYSGRTVREHGATTESDWVDHAFATVASVLRTLISQYSYNTLTAPATSDEHSLVTIHDEMLNAVRQKFDATDRAHGASGVEVCSIVVSF